MNIPQDILQQVADAAFLPSSKIRLITSNTFDDWKNQAKDRRAVIQRVLDNPALAPFLAGVGEYTDEEIRAAWTVLLYGEARSFEDRLRAFLAALPRRESPSIAEAIARAAEAEEKCAILQSQVDNADTNLEQMRLVWKSEADKLKNELSTLKSSQLGILRPIAEMPETVPAESKIG